MTKRFCAAALALCCLAATRPAAAPLPQGDSAAAAGPTKTPQPRETTPEVRAAEPSCPQAEVGAKAPPFSISMSDGTPGVVLREALGKKGPVVVVFWHHLCIPCQTELPMLQRLAEEPGHPATYLLIHSGPDEKRMKEKLQELGITLMSASDDTKAKAERYCVSELPRTFVLDREGVIRASLGEVTEARLRDELTRLSPHSASIE